MIKSVAGIWPVPRITYIRELRQSARLRVVLFACLSFLSAALRAVVPGDILPVSGVVASSADSARLEHLKREVDCFGEKHIFRATYLGVPMIAGGLLEKQYDKNFRRLRNDFMPRFRRTLDNYTQWTPAAVVLGLKAAGVPGRSSWGRMMVSDAFSVALMAGVVQGLKHSTSIMRPDGSNSKSFPSGHTATAFMSATMLSKEYGYISPWVSVGGYTLATGTGLMRMANNKHWLSDVMVGAGIGILSTEFGYWIADALMKKKGLNRPDDIEPPLESSRPPSFLGLYMGFNVPLSHYDVSNCVAYKTSMGTILGLEGAAFFNRYIGLGGRFTVSNLRFIVNDADAPQNTLKFYDYSVGPYFSLPLTKRFAAGTKLLAMLTRYRQTDIGGVVVPANSGLGLGTGLRLCYHVNRHFEFGIFADYNLQPPHSDHSGEYVHTMTLGTKGSIRF